MPETLPLGYGAAIPIATGGCRMTMSSKSEITAVARPPAPFERKLLLVLALGALAASGITPKDRLTWALETVWVMVAVPWIVLAWRRFPLTRLLCWLLLAHALVLVYGGAYTYAETPLGFWLRDTLLRVP
jgi:putative membrane protein